MSHKETKTERRSLDDIQNDFNSKVGHPPHSVNQMVSFCKQENHKWKYCEINKWWPTRPDPQSKPKEKPINEGEYKGKMVEEEEYFVDGCDLIKLCKSVKRLCLAMNFLKNWKQNNDKDDVLIQYFTNKYKHILNDYGHIIYHHLNKDQQKNNEVFKMMFDEINKEIQCDINTCPQYIRYAQNREFCETETNEENKTNLDLLFYINLMDTIHVHFVHSYDIGFRIKIDVNNVDENEDEMDYIQTLLNDKSELLQHLERKSRYNTKIQCIENKSEEHEIMERFNFGDMHRFYYWEHYENKEDEDSEYNNGYKYCEWYIKPHFNNFKIEILDKLSSTNYQNSLKKTQKFMQTEHVKCIKGIQRACNIYYGIQKMEVNEAMLTEEHLLSLIIFTDYNDLSQKLRNSFIKSSASESDESLKQRNSFYGHWSKAIRETIEIFGNDTQTTLNISSFYHGISSLPFVDKFNIRLNAPTSTTSQLPVAMIFNNRMILDIRQNESALEFFNCEFFSNYSNEDEKIFCGGSSLLKIYSLRVFNNLVNKWENYQHCMRALQFYENIMDGLPPSLQTSVKRDIVTQKDFNIISDLAANALGKQCKNKYPQYIHQLFELYCKEKETVTIDLSHTNHLYNFLEHLNGSKFSDLLLPFDEISVLYKNCENILVKKSQVILVFDAFFNHLLSMLDKINATNLKMITIFAVYVKCDFETFTKFRDALLHKNWILMVRKYETKLNDILISRSK